ncbi:phosphotransferase [Microlunatus spumicola]|uniref:Phosphotransferase n=1 Tax=Microlunatus spumicola TaxID=81499 RepID=A0ABP6WU27_9ACTN
MTAAAADVAGPPEGSPTGLPPAAAASLMHVVTGARWFAGKGRRPELRSFTPLPWLNDPPPPGDAAGAADETDGADEEVPRVRLAVLEVAYPDETGAPGDGAADAPTPGVEHYQLALAHRHHRLPAGLSGATELYVDGGTVVYDATQDVGGARVLLQALLAGTSVGDEQGGVRFHLRDAAALTPDLEPQVFRGQQSNTSVMFGDVAMLKLFRRLELGRNLDIQVHEALNDAGMTDVARLFGSVEATWTRDGEVLGADLAMCVEKLADAVDGWDLALASLESETRGAAREHGSPEGSDVGFATHAEALGRALAEVHEALRTAFGTATQAGSDVAATMTQRLAAARAVAPALAPYADGLRARFGALAGTELDAQRVHGDFHLGQTLHTPSGWKIIDFEGEPAKTMAERVAPDSVWRDVAGMMRSFDYAAASVPGEASGAWRDGCRDAFLSGYTGGRGLGADDAGLLAAYEADKAVYEVVYEVRNRPDWVGIPLGAVATLAAPPSGTTGP